MSLPLVFRGTAQLELDEAIAWYEKKRVGLGRQFRMEVERHLERASDQPQLFRRIRGKVRRVVLQHFPYSIFFLPESNRIVVLAVFHFRRAPQQLERRFSDQG